jgi:hypothetical protein
MKCLRFVMIVLSFMVLNLGRVNAASIEGGTVYTSGPSSLPNVFVSLYGEDLSVGAVDIGNFMLSPNFPRAGETANVILITSYHAFGTVDGVNLNGFSSWPSPYGYITARASFSVLVPTGSTDSLLTLQGQGVVSGSFTLFTNSSSQIVSFDGLGVGSITMAREICADESVCYSPRTASVSFTVVPEPGASTLLAIGLGVLILIPGLRLSQGIPIARAIVSILCFIFVTPVEAETLMVTNGIVTYGGTGNVTVNLSGPDFDAHWSDDGLVLIAPSTVSPGQAFSVTVALNAWAIASVLGEPQYSTMSNNITLSLSFNPIVPEGSIGDVIIPTPVSLAGSTLTFKGFHTETTRIYDLIGTGTINFLAFYDAVTGTYSPSYGGNTIVFSAPEPSMLILLTSGLISLALWQCHRKRSQQ